MGCVCVWGGESDSREPGSQPTQEVREGVLKVSLLSWVLKDGSR